MTNWLGLVVALMICLSAALVNNAPLYYFDSITGYYKQGMSILSSFTADAPSTSEGGDGGASASDDNVSGNRSATYAVLYAALWKMAGPWAVVAVNFLSVLAAVVLVGRVVARSLSPPDCPLLYVWPPLAIAGLTSLPFYVAYMMPDIYTGLALLSVAVLVSFSRNMRAGELLLAFVLIVAGVVSHRSTLAIVGLAFPFAAMAAIFVAGRKWWAPTAIIALALAIGVAELKGYETAAEKVYDKETVYSPFITARLIADGPGYAYLQENCPDPGIQTCLLAKALSHSDNPRRLTPSHIMFERSEDLGSFLLLTPQEQAQVAGDQREFAIDVFLSKPGPVILSVLKNTLAQAWRVQVDMTVPDEKISQRLAKSGVFDDPDFGRLTTSRDWLGPVSLFHNSIYLLSLAAIVAAFIAARGLERAHRVLVLIILLGVLVNAFVCGAVSQPASRYGARVSWLIPYVATMLSVLSFRSSLNLSPGAIVSKWK